MRKLSFTPNTPKIIKEDADRAMLFSPLRANSRYFTRSQARHSATLEDPSTSSFESTVISDQSNFFDGIMNGDDELDKSFLDGQDAKEAYDRRPISSYFLFSWAFVNAVTMRESVFEGAFELPAKSQDSPALTLVLDLDETLIHCSTDINQLPDYHLNFTVDFHEHQFNVYAQKYLERRPC